MGVLNLEEQLRFYRKYHYDSTNVLIHVVCIPTILFSTFLLFTNIPLLPGLSAKSSILCNFGMLGSVGYGLFYTLLDKQFGVPSLAVLPLVTYFLSKSVWTPETSPLVAFLHSFPLTAPSSSSVLSGITPTGLATILSVFSWAAQFIGHGFFEKRAPALFDNLLQALVLAPFFVVFEVAHFLGFRKDVIDRVDAAILPELQELHASRLKKKIH